MNRETLVCAGLIRDNDQGIKLLGDGEISKAFTVDVNKVSEMAKNKIVAAGGKIAEAIQKDKIETAENKDNA